MADQDFYCNDVQKLKINSNPVHQQQVLITPCVEPPFFFFRQFALGKTNTAVSSSHGATTFLLSCFGLFFFFFEKETLVQ